MVVRESRYYNIFDLDVFDCGYTLVRFFFRERGGRLKEKDGFYWLGGVVEVEEGTSWVLIYLRHIFLISFWSYFLRY